MLRILSPTPNDDSSSSDHHEDESSSMSILFPWISVLIGIFVYYIISRYAKGNKEDVFDYSFMSL